MSSLKTLTPMHITFKKRSYLDSTWQKGVHPRRRNYTSHIHPAPSLSRSRDQKQARFYSTPRRHHSSLSHNFFSSVPSSQHLPTCMGSASTLMSFVSPRKTTSELCGMPSPLLFRGAATCTAVIRSTLITAVTLEPMVSSFLARRAWTSGFTPPHWARDTLSTTS